MYKRIEEEVRSGLSVRGMCEAAAVSRAGYYRFAGVQEVDADVELRDEIQKIAIKMPAYGYRRVRAELKRHGQVVNHKRVRRIMREDKPAVHTEAFVRTDD